MSKLRFEKNGNAGFITLTDPPDTKTCSRVRFSCDCASAMLFSVEVMGGMLPGAGGIQRIADRLGRARTIRMMMLAEPILGEQAAALGIATHVVSSGELQKATAGCPSSEILRQEAA
jgi:enoyl-CoA hydratase/carnithine racemase